MKTALCLLSVRKFGNQAIVDVEGPIDESTFSVIKDKISYIKSTTDDDVILNLEHAASVDFDSLKRIVSGFSRKDVSLVNYEQLMEGSSADEFFRKYS